MASENEFDPRRETLVMETRTLFAPELKTLSATDREWLAEAVHAEPELASKLVYERSHTGFIREITIGVADVSRLYQQRVSK